MAVVASVVLAGLTREQYDQIRATVGWLDDPPQGGISHTAWWEGNDCHGSDAWESEEAFQVFGQTRLEPAMAALGIQADLQVTFHQAHEVFLPKSVTIAGQ